MNIPLMSSYPYFTKHKPINDSRPKRIKTASDWSQPSHKRKSCEMKKNTEDREKWEDLVIYILDI